MLPADAPKHLLGIGEPDDLLLGIGLGIDLFDCAVPTRLARHGMALAPLPDSRFRFDVARPRAREPRPARWSTAAPARPAPVHSRAYLHYLARAEAPTAARLLTLHNLTFLQRLVSGARSAIEAERFGAYRTASWRPSPGRPVATAHARTRKHKKNPRRSRGQLIRASGGRGASYCVFCWMKSLIA